MHQLFLDEVDGSLISLHSTLADPAAYGLTHYPKTFGGISLEPVSYTHLQQTAAHSELL